MRNDTKQDIDQCLTCDRKSCNNCVSRPSSYTDIQRRYYQKNRTRLQNMQRQYYLNCTKPKVEKEKEEALKNVEKIKLLEEENAELKKQIVALGKKRKEEEENGK